MWVITCGSSSNLVLITSGFETASLPITPDALRQQLLNFAIVGGGREFTNLLLLLLCVLTKT